MTPAGPPQVDTLAVLQAVDITAVDLIAAFSTAAVVLLAIVALWIERRDKRERRAAMDANVRMIARELASHLGSWTAEAKAAGGPSDEWVLKLKNTGKNAEDSMKELVRQLPGASRGISKSVRAADTYLRWVFDRFTMLTQGNPLGEPIAQQVFNGLIKCQRELGQAIGPDLMKQIVKVQEELGIKSPLPDGSEFGNVNTGQPDG